MSKLIECLVCQAEINPAGGGWLRHLRTAHESVGESSIQLSIGFCTPETQMSQEAKRKSRTSRASKAHPYHIMQPSRCSKVKAKDGKLLTFVLGDLSGPAASSQSSSYRGVCQHLFSVSRMPIMERISSPIPRPLTPMRRNMLTVAVAKHSPHEAAVASSRLPSSQNPTFLLMRNLSTSSMTDERQACESTPSAITPPTASLSPGVNSFSISGEYATPYAGRSDWTAHH